MYPSFLSRFTPTGVGTASSRAASARSASVHPHRRGDGAYFHAFWVSPFRFTPTGVGTAAWPRGSSHSAPVHPHRRGDGKAVVVSTDIANGSPPQAWGRLPKVAVDRGKLRFTPTGVGTARPKQRVQRRVTVHPHRRGDGTSDRAISAARCGSPPQAWGRRLILYLPHHATRFTPTGVGTAGTNAIR